MTSFVILAAIVLTNLPLVKRVLFPKEHLCTTLSKLFPLKDGTQGSLQRARTP